MSAKKYFNILWKVLFELERYEKGLFSLLFWISTKTNLCFFVKRVQMLTSSLTIKKVMIIVQINNCKNKFLFIK